MTGTIKTLPKDKETGQSKGYGFIRGDDGIEYFLHRSGLERTTCAWADVQEGFAVDFTPIEGVQGKGPRAIECRVTSV